MSFKKCEKCGEEVSIVKAFCPECGNPFVTEEKREEATEFEKNAGTMIFSKTAFNIMLDKMDLDTSRTPEAKKEEVKEPIKEKNAVRIQIDTPAADFPPRNKTPDQTKKTGNRKWIIGALGALFFIFVIAAILIGFYFYSNR